MKHPETTVKTPRTAARNLETTVEIPETTVGNSETDINVGQQIELTHWHVNNKYNYDDSW